MQRLLAVAAWNADAVRDELQAYLVEHLGDLAGVLVVDETGFPTQGAHSVGVARQCSGTTGRRENQQIGVFLAYAGRRGCGLVDRAGTRPEVWAADRRGGKRPVCPRRWSLRPRANSHRGCWRGPSPPRYPPPG